MEFFHLKNIKKGQTERKFFFHRRANATRDTETLGTTHMEKEDEPGSRSRNVCFPSDYTPRNLYI